MKLFFALIVLLISSFSNAQEVVDIQKYKIELPNNLIKASGGFYPGIGSGIEYHKKYLDGSLEFFAISDRGPNFPLDNADDKIISFYPEFSPKIVRIIVDAKANTAEVKDFMEMNYQGKAVTGINANQNDNDEEIYDNKLNKVVANFGLDTESISMFDNDDFVVGDEYYPSINVVNHHTGEIIKRFVPGDGLPEILKNRNFNKGFESVTVAPNGKIYAMLEGCLVTETKLIRMIEIDPKNNTTKMYAYPFDYSAYKDSSRVKIGDITAIDDYNFLVVEQGPGIDNNYRNIIYKININNASDISNNKDLENISFIKKELLFNPRDYGWSKNKLEGLTVIDDKSIAITNDNDFAIKGYNKSSEEITAITDEKEQLTDLWIISFKDKL